MEYIENHIFFNNSKIKKKRFWKNKKQKKKQKPKKKKSEIRIQKKGNLERERNV